MREDNSPVNSNLSSEREGMLSDLNSWATLQGLLPRLKTEDDIQFLMKSE